MRTRKNTLNIVIGVISQLIILGMGLIVPRVILTHYGSDTNGLTNTITQIFTYMALLQAGIAQAAKNALYKPIQDGDKHQISVVLSSAKLYYKKITIIYACIVVCASLLLPFILKSNVAYWTIFFVIFFEGFTDVVSFYFITTMTTFLTASGKDYIRNIIELFGRTLCYTVKIVLALLDVNIALIQFGYFLVSIIKTLLYSKYIKNNYKWINLKEETHDYKLPDRNAFVITEIAWTVFSSTDMIVLSSFVSTAISSVYSIYNMVYVAIHNLLNTVYNSVSYNLGLEYNRNKNDYVILHDKFTSLFVGGMTILMCTTYILIIPFVELYTKGVKDVNYIYHYLPMMFCLVQILSWSRYVQGTLIGFAGYASKVTKVSIIEASLNVILSICFVSKLGIIGVLLATVIVLPLKIIYSTYLADKVILKRSCRKTIVILFSNYAYFFICTYICKFIRINISGVISFVIYGALYLLLFGMIGIVINICANPGLVSKKLN